VSAFIVSVHAWLRWFILLAGAAATARALLAWRRGSAWSVLDARLGRAFAVSLDVQWVIGLALFGGASLLGGRALASEGLGILASPELTFWAILHPLLASAALALVHLGRIRMRSRVGAARHRTAALSYGAAMALLVMAVR
jgi:hypothetical protein